MQYARDIGLNMQKFEQDLQNHTFIPRIEEDLESGECSGVEGTPTFFINGVKYNGSYELPYRASGPVSSFINAKISCSSLLSGPAFWASVAS